MDHKEIGKIFYRDGYRIAVQHLEGETSVSNLKEAIRTLYREVDGLLEAFLRRSAEEGKPADCKIGCSWCCHQEVFAITHELLYLHDHVLQNSDRKEREGFISRAREKSFLPLVLSLSMGHVPCMHPDPWPAGSTFLPQQHPVRKSMFSQAIKRSFLTCLSFPFTPAG